MRLNVRVIPVTLHILSYSHTSLKQQQRKRMRVHKLGKRQGRQRERYLKREFSAVCMAVFIFFQCNRKLSTILTYTRSKRQVSKSLKTIQWFTRSHFQYFYFCVTGCYILLDISLTSSEETGILYFHVNILFLIACLYSSDL